MADLKADLDAVLARVTRGPEAARVPGVVAMVTDREGIIYEGAAGHRSLHGDAAMTADTVFALFSTSKAITATAVLQCIEDGLLDPDAPVRAFVPEIGELPVIEGFDAEGQPVLRPPRTEITARMLLLHTAGFGYDFFNETYRRLACDHGQPGVAAATRTALMTPLLFDPGESWEYGSSMDWAGLVVEAIRGKPLGDVLEQRIFRPLEMHDTAFRRRADMKARTAAMHRREEDGGLKPTRFALPDAPEVQMGGHGLYGTVADYMAFIRMWLDDGAGPAGRVLKPDTIARAVRSGLSPDQKVRPLRGVDRAMSNDVEFFPGIPKSWASGFMVNEADAPTGRPAGSLGWAGLANLYYWIDRKNGVGGFWATQILPFFDAVSRAGAEAMEARIYHDK